jgi:hypothetical protein
MPPLEAISPHVLGFSPASPAPGSAVTFTVGLDGTALGTESYPVTQTTSAFSVLPTPVSPAAGATSLQFVATLSSSFTGSVTVTVSGQQENASVTVVVS